jgi:hypothetical protein
MRLSFAVDADQQGSQTFHTHTHNTQKTLDETFEYYICKYKLLLHVTAHGKSFAACILLRLPGTPKNVLGLSSRVDSLCNSESETDSTRSPRAKLFVSARLQNKVYNF